MNTLSPTSRSGRRPATPVLAILLCGVLAQACATSGSSAPPASSGPVELDKTKWKLVALGGVLDGRVVEFHKRGETAYVGKLVDMGRRLRDVVGLQLGYDIFQLRKKSDTEYEGLYQAIDPQGGIQGKEIVVFVNGNQITWNQESAVWERVE